MSTSIFEDLDFAYNKGHKLNCIGYSRVSTHHEEQSNSLIEQRKAIENFAKKYNLNLISNFYEMASGKSDIRENYTNLLNAIRTLEIDYVLVKDDTRLNRSVENTTRLLRILSAYNVKVYFLLDGITVDPNNSDDVFRIQINSVFGEKVSRDQSIKGRYSHKKKCNEKRLSRQNECYGFRFNKITQEMELEPFESSIIKRIFEMYVYEDKGPTQISKELYDLGVQGFGNNKYISSQAIKKYLKNSAYYGDMTFNHRVTTTFDAGHEAITTRIKVSPSEYVHCEVPPIITKELFDLAQRKIELAKKEMDCRYPNGRSGSNFKGKHIFAKKVVCGDCGNTYLHRTGGRKNVYSYYYCSQKKRVRRKDKSCTNSIQNSSTFRECTTLYDKILESTLCEVTTSAIEKCYVERNACYENILQAINYAISNTSKDSVISKKNTLVERVKELENTLSRTIDRITKVDEKLIPMLEQKALDIQEELELLQSQLSIEDQRDETLQSSKERLQDIKEFLDKMKNFKELTQEEVNRYIERIVINNNGTLDIFMNFGNTITSPIPTNYDVPNPNVGNIITQGALC